MNRPRKEHPLVIGGQLRQAREMLQLTLDEVSRSVRVAASVLTDWEEGESVPGLKQLEILADIYGREIDYFLKETPSPPKDIEFRGKPGKSLKDLSNNAKKVLARFDELCRTAYELETLLSEPREITVPRFSQDVPPEVVAGNLREEFDAGQKPIPTLRQMLEAKGLLVFELPVPDDEFSGYSFWHSDYGPCVLLHAGETPGRRNFTLAHELAHLVYGHASGVCYIPLSLGQVRRGLEHRANGVAVELLLPKDGVLEDCRERDIWPTPEAKQLAVMARKWGVSIQALGYRLENLGKVTKGHTDALLEVRPRYFGRGKTPTWERRLGRRFVETSFKAYHKNLITVGKLAHSLGIPIRKAIEETKRRSG